ncbi:hypothetical protein [Candidatus Nesciobacter abundans]|uniref:Uncharacterized protein n=1 Tax=Candidatus Nesciobacter abundans TaxID=2601668 RepID=A0A5C0UFW9_9PROT|nr:hypothetical protein [Candidatus Nesciobacter abundans]QEK38996.1 hypothetical protein FZC36_00915 [Candidatus Nesciobacter abundans]
MYIKIRNKIKKFFQILTIFLSFTNRAIAAVQEKELLTEIEHSNMLEEKELEFSFFGDFDPNQAPLHEKQLQSTVLQVKDYTSISKYFADPISKPDLEEIEYQLMHTAKIQTGHEQIAKDFTETVLESLKSPFQSSTSFFARKQGDKVILFYTDASVTYASIDLKNAIKFIKSIDGTYVISEEAFFKNSADLYLQEQQDRPALMNYNIPALYLKGENKTLTKEVDALNTNTEAEEKMSLYVLLNFSTLYNSSALSIEQILEEFEMEITDQSKKFFKESFEKLKPYSTKDVFNPEKLKKIKAMAKPK